MPNKTINDLTDGGQLQANDQLYVLRGGNQDRKVTGSKLLGIGTKDDETGTTDTLALTDAGLVKNYTNNSAVTVTVPPNASVAFPNATTIVLRQAGTGQITVAPGAGVTLRSKYGYLKSEAQYAQIMLYKLDTDEWQVSGELVP